MSICDHLFLIQHGIIHQLCQSAYSAENERIKIDVRLENEIVWRSQKLMADLFQVTVPTINEHIINVFYEKELMRDGTIRKFQIIQKEGR